MVTVGIKGLNRVVIYIWVSGHSQLHTTWLGVNSGVQLQMFPRHRLIRDIHLPTFQPVRPPHVTTVHLCRIVQVPRLACWNRRWWFAAGRAATASLCERSVSTMATPSTTRYITSLWWDTSSYIDVYSSTCRLHNVSIADMVED